MPYRVIVFLILSGVSLLFSVLYISPLVHLASGINHLIWQIWWFMKGFDQKLLWLLLSLVVLVIFCIRIAPAVAQITYHEKRPKWFTTSNNLQNWSNAFKGALNKKDDYACWNLAENLFSLYSQFFFYRYGINQFQFKKTLLTGNNDFPPEIAAYLKTGCQPFTSVEKRSPLSIRTKVNPLDLNPELVIAHLEELYRDDS